MERHLLETLTTVGAEIAAQFGSSCEVVIHDLKLHPDHSIVAIFNGHVSGRKVGDGGSSVVMERLAAAEETARDRYCYLTRTPDGKLLKSSTAYIRDRRGAIAAIFSINFDLTLLAAAEGSLRDFLALDPKETGAEPQRITNVTDLLDDLIAQSVALVGKPVSLMTKDDKIRAIRFLQERKAFLVTKSSDKIAKFFGISKYSLYAYLSDSDKDLAAQEQEG